MADHAKVHPEQATRKRSMDIGDESSRSVLIQFPKDQILRQAPSTDNYHHGRRNPKRSRSAFCCYLAWFFGSIFFVVVILLIIAGIFYLVLSPRVPQYSVERVETRSFNFSTNSGLTSEFYIAILAENRNSNIGIYYEEGNSLAFFYSGIKLCSGSFPGLYQGHGNVTVLEASLTGSGVPLSEEVYSSLVNQEKEKRVPLEIEIDVPVKIKAGILKLPKITIRVRCTVILTGLAPNQDTQIESKSCKGHGNVTDLEASLTGSDVPLSEELYSSLVNQEKEKKVPLEIEIDVPVKIKAGILKLPKITIRVRCTVIMTGLAPNQDTQIESKSCKVKKNIL